MNLGMEKALLIGNAGDDSDRLGWGVLGAKPSNQRLDAPPTVLICGFAEFYLFIMKHSGNFFFSKEYRCNY